MGVRLTVNQTVLSLLSFIGITGNILVILLILKKFKLESWTYILVCHLGTTDLLTCAVGGPLWIAAYTTKLFPVCKAAIALSTIPLTVSSFTLILIAYDRYVYIRYPLRHPNIVTCRKIVTLLALFWTLALSSGSLSVTIGMNTSRDLIKRDCIFSLLVDRWNILWIFACFALAPITVLPFVYSYILRTALRQSRKVHEFTNNEDHKAKVARLRKERNTISMLSAVVLVFIISTLPFAVVALIDAFSGRIFRSGRWLYLTSVLLFLNAVVNPFLYTFTNRDLRREAYKVFQRGKFVA